MVFQPSMEQDAGDGFYALVESLLDDVFNFASLVPRVAKHKEQTDYHTDVEEVSIQQVAVWLSNIDGGLHIHSLYFISDSVFNTISMTWFLWSEGGGMCTGNHCMVFTCRT